MVTEQTILPKDGALLMRHYSASDIAVALDNCDDSRNDILEHYKEACAATGKVPEENRDMNELLPDLVAMGHELGDAKVFVATESFLDWVAMPVEERAMIINSARRELGWIGIKIHDTDFAEVSLGSLYPATAESVALLKETFDLMAEAHNNGENAVVLVGSFSEDELETVKLLSLDNNVGIINISYSEDSCLISSYFPGPIEMEDQIEDESREVFSEDDGE